MSTSGPDAPGTSADSSTGGQPPSWLRGLADDAEHLPGERFSQFQSQGRGRESAVLILFGPSDPSVSDASVVLTERSHQMRSHPGQVSFPGGGAEEGDGGPQGTALREAWEEIDLQPHTVDVLATLPTLHLPVSNHDVTPVLGWWREPSPESIWAKDPREVNTVIQPPVSYLVDPESRFRVRHPSGFIGPAWEYEGLLIWGFTAGILDRVLALSGVAQPWDEKRIRDLPL